MIVKPGDFFFGLMEFLAYIVPGFVLSITLPIYLNIGIPCYLDVKRDDPTIFSWIAFILISYIAGHFIHHLCAMLLNPLYEISYAKIKQKEYHEFLNLAENAIKERFSFHSDYLKIAEGFLRLNHSGLVAEIEVYEANSKLFRSLTVLGIYLCFFPKMPIAVVVILVIASFFSFLKFANQRWTYRFVVYEYFLLEQSGQ
ncbi:hypothetical protein CFS9_01270 [Flavobacterium sp. CFS9]|uniref:ABC transmembrane type-1 domain-containing protein n=1 Tax=Flavobacterium sp. CFS9 TaxID=3143118 RepID=A0AAT9GW78_9FLAO